jgi:uncharacterized membrane protein YdjX (TVP38/TMEM64 family)
MEIETQTEPRRGWGRKRLLPLLVGALFIAVITIVLGPTEQWLFRAMEWIDGAGAVGVVAFGALYVTGTILFVPATLLSLCAGFLFGNLAGIVLVSLCTTVGAIAAFLASRYLVRRQVQARVARVPKFQAIERAVSREGFKMAFLTRLVPILPFSVLNYSFGLTRVGARRFLFATWLGMFPTSIAYVYVGAAAGDLTRAMAMDEPPGLTTYALWGLGLAAVVAIVWLITRRARQELDAILGEAAPGSPDGDSIVAAQEPPLKDDGDSLAMK